MLWATKKGVITPALLGSEPVFCSRPINPRLSRKMCLRARIYATYGRSVRFGAELFPTESRGCWSAITNRSCSTDS